MRHATPPCNTTMQASAERMVRDGELPADVFAEELEELPDMERDYAEEYAAEVGFGYFRLLFSFGRDHWRTRKQRCE
jgi:hypothetical protein